MGVTVKCGDHPPAPVAAKDLVVDVIADEITTETGVDILQKKPKNALTGKNSAPAKFPKLSNISRIK